MNANSVSGRIHGSVLLLVGGLLWLAQVVSLVSGSLGNVTFAQIMAWIGTIGMILVAIGFIQLARGTTGEDGMVGSNVLGKSALWAVAAGLGLWVIAGIVMISGRLSSLDALLWLYWVIAILIVGGSLVAAIVIAQEGRVRGLTAAAMFVFAAAAAFHFLFPMIVTVSSLAWGLVLPLALVFLGLAYLLNPSQPAGSAVPAGIVSDGAAPKTKSDIVVEITDLYAGYLPGINIITGANLVARKGELVGIIGPNGAGKSTLLKAIFGMVKVREGEITVDGESVLGLKSDQLVRRGVGFVPQTNNVFPSLTIEENLQMGLYQKPKVYAERLEFVTGIFAELGARLKQRAGSLSGGERQMVAMSRALMMDPSVLLLDEPSAGLSPVRQDDAFIRVSDINKAGVTTIMVEQNARRCLQICDRGYVLDQGKDAYTGTGRELLNDPKVIGLYLGTLGAD